MPVAKTTGQSPSGLARYTGHLRRQPRLILATVLAIVLFFLLPHAMRVPSRLVASFDGGAVVFLGAIWVMMAQSTEDSIRRRAQFEDSGRVVVLGLAVAVAVAILLAIVFQLHGLKDLPPSRLFTHVGLAIVTILVSWLFMNTQFALHYAHGYYGDPPVPGNADTPVGGLAFPGGGKLDYWDFVYFSFVIGMTFQVSDVGIKSHRLRRVALAHGVLAFFFNVVVLSLTINIVAGLI